MQQNSYRFAACAKKKICRNGCVTHSLKWLHLDWDDIHALYSTRTNTLLFKDKTSVEGTIRIEGVSFTVVGILSTRDYVQQENSTITARNFNRAVLLPIGAEPTADSRYSGYTDLIFRFSESRFVKPGAVLIQQIVLNNHGGFEDFQTIVPIELLSQANRTRRTFNVIVGIIAAITLLVRGR